MNEAKMFEMLGRKQAALELGEANFASALQCMAHMLTGEIDPSRVMVDLTNKGFNYVAAGERPPVPPVINGLPNCVVQVGPANAELKAEVEALRDANRLLAEQVEALKAKAEPKAE